jgi:TRAP transporter TAXI family solute receptor
MRKTLFTAPIVAMAFAGPAAAQSYNLTLAGYSPGGLLSTVGAGIDAALNAGYPGSTVTYQTGSGGLANAMLLEQKKVPLALIGSTELKVAVKGLKPIPKPLTDLRLLVQPYAASSRFQATHALVNKDWAAKHGITTVADIAAKRPPMRVAFNRPGNLDGDVGIAVFTANGISLDDVKNWGGQVVRAASREMTSLMLDRRLDGVVFGISINHPRIREMVNGLELVMLPLKKETAKKVADELGAETCDVKAAEYKFLASDTSSICVGMNLVVRADMDDETAYNVTKAIVENSDKYKAAHPLLQKAVTNETLAGRGLIPHHPGAVKYLKEKGLLK